MSFLRSLAIFLWSSCKHSEITRRFLFLTWSCRDGTFAVLHLQRFSAASCYGVFLILQRLFAASYDKDSLSLRRLFLHPEYLTTSTDMLYVATDEGSHEDCTVCVYARIRRGKARRSRTCVRISVLHYLAREKPSEKILIVIARGSSTPNWRMIYRFLSMIINRSFLL